MLRQIAHHELDNVGIIIDAADEQPLVTTLPDELNVRRFDRTEISYWVQWFYDDVHCWTGLYENHITNDREQAYRTFFDRDLDQHFLFPLPVTKVVLVRFDPSSQVIDVIDARYN